MHLLVDKVGNVKRQPPGSHALKTVGLPTGVYGLQPTTRPDAILFQGVNRMPMVGAWSQNLIWLPKINQLCIMGITAPTSAPSLAAAAGPGPTGNAIGVVTFAHVFNGAIIAESNPSPTTATVPLANQARAWTSLPTTHPNPRVTHIRLYVSMDGSEFEFVAMLSLGTASFTENIATASLGEAVAFTNGVPPYAKFVTIYQRRAWYANGTDTIYYSEIDQPESVNAANNVKTPDGRNVSSIRGLTDTLLIGTRRSLMYLQGYSATDFRMGIISQDVGIISHFGALVINDKCWFPAQDGYYRFSGSGIEPLMSKVLRTYFRQQYEANPALYEDIQASISKRSNVVRVLVPDTSAFYYIGHYLPSEVSLGGTGEPPYWTFDRRTRKDYSVGVLTNNSMFDTAYTGSCDGYAREEDVDSDATDDGDSYQKKLTIASRHFFMGDQSGDDNHAHTFTNLDLFLVSEQVAWSPAIYVGDDDAYSALAPAWNRNGVPVPASALTVNGKTAVKKTSHSFGPLTNCAGKGATVAVTAVLPLGFEYRGLALHFTFDGQQTRPRAS